MIMNNLKIDFKHIYKRLGNGLSFPGILYPNPLFRAL